MSSIFTSAQLNRRHFLKGAAATAGTAALGTSLAACGGGTGDSGGVTVQYWDWWVSQAPWVDNEIKLFQAANPKIKIRKTTNATNTYDNLFNLAVKGKNVPDVFMISGTATPFNDQAHKGWLLPIDKYVDEAWKSRFPEGTFHEGSNIIDGKLYSAPLSGSAPWVQLYINSAVFKDAGLTNSDGSVKIPETWDDVTHFAETITKKGNGNSFGLGFGNGAFNLLTWWVEVFIRGAGSPGGSDGLDQRTGKYTFSSDRNYEDFLKLFLEWKQKGYFFPTSLSNTDEIARANFEQGKFGMTIGGVWNQAEWTQHKFTDYHLTTVVGPQKERKGYFYHSPGGYLFAASSATKHPDESMAWLKWLYSEEAGKRWVQQFNEDLSVFDKLNDPQTIGFKPFAEFVKTSPLSLAGPDVGVRNPETSKVVFNAVKPDFGDTIVGLYTGQLKDIKGSLSDLQGRMQTARDNAIKQAQSNGAKVSADDWAFSDWDITKPYITKPKQA